MVIIYCQCRGGVAHLGERLNGIQEVVGSIPIISTKMIPQNCGIIFYFRFLFLLFIFIPGLSVDNGLFLYFFIVFIASPIMTKKHMKYNKTNTHWEAVIVCMCAHLLLFGLSETV